MRTAADFVVTDESGHEVASVRLDRPVAPLRFVWSEDGRVRFRMEKGVGRTGSWRLFHGDGESIGEIDHVPFTNRWRLDTHDEHAEGRVARAGRPVGAVVHDGRELARVERETTWSRLVFTRRRVWRLEVDDPMRRGVGDLVLALPIVLDTRERARNRSDGAAVA